MYISEIPEFFFHLQICWTDGSNANNKALTDWFCFYWSKTCIDKLWPMEETWPYTCFCKACEIRFCFFFFYSFKWLESIKRRVLLQCSWIQFYWNSALTTDSWAAFGCFALSAEGCVITTETVRGLKTLKYWPSGFFQKKLVGSWYRQWSHNNSVFIWHFPQVDL